MFFLLCLLLLQRDRACATYQRITFYVRADSSRPVQPYEQDRLTTRSPPGGRWHIRRIFPAALAGLALRQQLQLSRRCLWAPSERIRRFPRARIAWVAREIRRRAAPSPRPRGTQRKRRRADEIRQRRRRGAARFLGRRPRPARRSLWRYYKQLARPDRPLALFVQGHVLCTCAMASAIGFPSLPESRLAQWIRWNKVVY